MSKVACFLLSVVLSVGAVANAEQVQAPTTVRMERITDRVSFPRVEPVKTERDLVVESATECREYAGLAYDIGWPAGEIPHLLAIMHRESRCNPEACSESDSGRVCRDWGLMQINEYSWRTTIRKQGMVMSDMWNPELNLRFALWLWTYSEERNGDGWQPWAIPHS